VSHSGFYRYRQRRATSTIDRDEVARIAHVKAIAHETRDRYGRRRMAKQLQDDGGTVGRYKARRLMRPAGVAVRRPRQRRPVTTDRRHGHPVAPTLLARQCDVEQPDQVWVGEVTYMWTAEGWLYVSVLLDLYSRKGVGWATSSRLDTALVPGALEMALGRRQPGGGLLHHADRGRQYAGQAAQGLLANAGVRCRMRRKGDCLDNAGAERFLGSLKRERPTHCQYTTRQEARDDIVDYLERFYNSKRKHSYLGYRSPNEYEALRKVA
jgi:transposase InsO family protein